MDGGTPSPTHEIVLRDLPMAKEPDFKKDIEWLCQSLGLIAGRDTERTASKIIQDLLREVSNFGSASSMEIASQLGIAVQRVNYHLRSLANRGFIYRKKKRIYLRQGSVKAAIEEIRKDANRIFDNLSRIAEEIDNSLGLKNR